LAGLYDVTCGPPIVGKPEFETVPQQWIYVARSDKMREVNRLLVE